MGLLEERIAELERRVALLEEAPARRPSPADARSRPSADTPLDLLDLIRSRAGGQAQPGTIMYGGAVTFEDRNYLWAMEHEADEVADAHWAGAAALLERLGSGPRLALLAALLKEPRTRRELQETLGETSTGHLYHHLKELQSAGLLVQPRRGEYAIAPRAVVPLMTIVAVTMDLATTGSPEEELA
ncbi:helix-turn-helix transcriptional regulator [Nonomuraea sp. NN258]|uniref:helix-turn-helix domain-containing protein n=1 Tax=Nonomuraea antri TaxID=2730852 RepID=UPI00156A3B18|nr:helix-turn-helix domain-containing protein [Nonomuraea antri]NRQ32425.1 helix-turn-helix transcriptional regulator [Nonomuraea antri]